MFRDKKSIPLKYNEQGEVYFHCKQYKELTEAEQGRIRETCKEAGGQYSKAVFIFMTTDIGITKICHDCYCSESTLRRCVKKFYVIQRSKMKSDRKNSRKKNK